MVLTYLKSMDTLALYKSDFYYYYYYYITRCSGMAHHTVRGYNLRLSVN